MSDRTLNVGYDYAHVLLDKEESRSFLGKRFSENVLYKGDFNKPMTTLTLAVGGGYIMEIHGISVPPARAIEFSTKNSIIKSVRNIAGDFGGSLDRCAELAQGGVIQSQLYFSDGEMCDYSRRDSHFLESMRVTQRINEAKKYLSDINGVVPRDMRLPEGLEVKFVPTFQTMRNVEGLGRTDDKSRRICGETFADCVANFLGMYDIVRAHLKWKEDEATRMHMENMKNGDSRNSCRDIYVAELGLPR